MRIIPVLEFCVFLGRDRADFSHFRKKMSLGMRNLRIIPFREAIFSSVMIPRATSPGWPDTKDIGTHQYSLVTQANMAVCAPSPFSQLPRQWSQPGPGPSTFLKALSSSRLGVLWERHPEPEPDDRGPALVSPLLIAVPFCN